MVCCAARLCTGSFKVGVRVVVGLELCKIELTNMRGWE
jgi:hypothetical protein